MNNGDIGRHRRGDPRPGGWHPDGRAKRRMVLAAIGGVLITGTGVSVAAATSGGTPVAARPVVPPTRRPSPTTSRSEQVTAASQGKKVSAVSRREPAQASSSQAPLGPVYYIDDGPMTVALTIDDGPSPVYTPQMLRLLAEYGVTATFSMVGRNVASYPGIAREVAGAGHLIANHTWSHADMPVLRAAMMREEVRRAEGEIHAVTGRLPTLFRAPYGAWSTALLEYCAAHRLTPLDWSVDPQDWARPGVTTIVRDILRRTRTGSIILEHDGGGDRSQTVAALRTVVPSLLDEGFRFRLP